VTILTFDMFRTLLVEAVQEPVSKVRLTHAAATTKLRDVCDSLGEVEIQIEIGSQLDLDVTCDQFTDALTLQGLYKLCVGSC